MLNSFCHFRKQHTDDLDYESKPTALIPISFCNSVPSSDKRDLYMFDARMNDKETFSVFMDVL